MSELDVAGLVLLPAPVRGARLGAGASVSLASPVDDLIERGRLPSTGLLAAFFGTGETRGTDGVTDRAGEARGEDEPTPRVDPPDDFWQYLHTHGSLRQSEMMWSAASLVERSLALGAGSVGPAIG